MQKILGLLRELQTLDQELIVVRQQRKKLEEEEAALGADVERVQSMLDSLMDNISELQAKRKELSHALDLEQENVKRAEGRLPSIKTQKEYVAVLKEIDTAKKLNKELQDKMQAVQAEISSFEGDRGEKEAELDALKQKSGARRQEIAEVMSGHDAVIGAGEAKRSQILQEMPTGIQRKYQMLFDRRAGIAVVAARNGTCAGCNMHLPPQLYNNLFRTPEILSCPHCNRMLYLETEQ